jgi:hypothetical protein
MVAPIQLSDLVQRIARRRELKTRIEKRFNGWHHMLLNSILNFAAERNLERIYSPTADLVVKLADPNRRHSLQHELVANANAVAQEMGWNLKNQVMDMRTLSFNSKFDDITSICVYEHIPMYDRVSINRRLQELLAPGGRFSITFDYRNPSRLARIHSSDDVFEQFIKPFGLAIRGNQEFADNGKNYLFHPFYAKQKNWIIKLRALKRRYFNGREIFRTKDCNDYTFGALFLENPTR